MHPSPECMQMCSKRCPKMWQDPGYYKNRIQTWHKRILTYKAIDASWQKDWQQRGYRENGLIFMCCVNFTITCYIVGILGGVLLERGECFLDHNTAKCQTTHFMVFSFSCMNSEMKFMPQMACLPCGFVCFLESGYATEVNIKVWVSLQHTWILVTWDHN